MMLALYGSLFSIFLIGLGFIVVPFIKQQQKSPAIFIATILLIAALAGLLYQLTGNTPALKEWLTHGQKRYELLNQWLALGGLNGAIEKIENRLRTHPEDKKGWLILSKLYRAKGNDPAADKALKKANN